MIRKFLIPLLAVLGVAFAVYTVRQQHRARPVALPVAAPSTSPYGSAVAGAGLIEAASQNIAIGTHVAGIVAEVLVRPGDDIAAGAPLFRVDDRAQRATLAVRQAELDAAQSKLDMLLAQPRPEEVPPAEALVAATAAVLADAESQLAKWDSVTDERALVREELDRKRYAVALAKARLAADSARLDLLKAGAWEPEVLIARAGVQSARAALDSAQVELARLTVRAPMECQVLQVNVRPGEFAPAGALTPPLMLVGQTKTLHIRADVDENDAWRVTPGAKARATLRGNSAIGTDLTFVRVGPYVIPKSSLTGESTERVDTRVLQVLYAFPRGAMNAYVGQLVDVYIEAPPAAPEPPPARSSGGPS